MVPRSLAQSPLTTWHDAFPDEEARSYIRYRLKYVHVRYLCMVPLEEIGGTVRELKRLCLESKRFCLPPVLPLLGQSLKSHADNEDAV